MTKAIFMTATASKALDHLVAADDAYLARIDWFVADCPWKAGKRELDAWRAETRKGYVVHKYMKAKRAGRAEAEVFVAANYAGISKDDHALREFFDAAKTQLSRDFKAAAKRYNAKQEDKAARVDVVKLTGGANQSRAPRPASNPADAPAPTPAPAPVNVTPAKPEAVLVKAEALPEAMRAHVAEAVKAAKAFKAVNGQAMKGRPAVAEAWAELIAGLEKQARILALALDAAK